MSDEPIVRNAVQCKICGGAGDCYVNRFQCQNNPSHMADLNVGIWSDLTPPEMDDPEFGFMTPFEKGMKQLYPKGWRTRVQLHRATKQRSTRFTDPEKPQT